MDRLEELESCFAELKKRKETGNQWDKNCLEQALSSHLKKHITVNLCNVKRGSPMFIMSVTPEESTIQKILKYMDGKESKLDAICDVWKACDNWRLDIDTSIIDFLSSEELVALTLHEMHHIMESTAVPTRIVNIIQFGIANSTITQKAMLMNRQLQKVLKLPVFSACQAIIDKRDLRKSVKLQKNAFRKEMLADAYAKEKGYAPYLISAIDKISSHIKNLSTVDKDTEDMFQYSMRILDSLNVRKNLLAQDDLTNAHKYMPEGVLSETVDDIISEWFNEDGEISSYIVSATEHMKEKYFMEFGIDIKFHKLDPIERNQIDYIAVKVQEIKTINDKLMCLSYINSKLDLAEYYKNILETPKLCKKYRVPHTYDQLTAIINQLSTLREQAMKKTLPSKGLELYVNYPTNYIG